MRVDVVLVQPPSLRWADVPRRHAQPLNLLSLATTVKRSGVDVRIIDMVAEGYTQQEEIQSHVFRYGMPLEELGERIEELRPKIIGISFNYTFTWGESLRVAEFLKKEFPEVILIGGGRHLHGLTSPSPENRGSYRPALKLLDFILLGEAFCTFPVLVQKILRNEVRRPRSRSGDTEAQILTADDFSEEDLKSTDCTFDYDLDLLNHENYVAAMAHFEVSQPVKFFTYLSQRGCPIGCKFCTVPFFDGLKLRLQPQSVYRKNFRAIAQWGYKQIVLQDDNLTVWPKKALREYLHAAAEEVPNLYLDGGLYLPAITEALIEELAQLPIYGVFVPYENERLTFMKKLHKYNQLTKSVLRKFKEVAEGFEAFGIPFYTAMMVGFPEEDMKDIDLRFQFAEKIKNLGARYVSIHWVHPYPGTPFYEIYYPQVPEDRRWEHHPEYYDFSRPVFKPSQVTYEELEELTREWNQKLNGIEARLPGVWEEGR